jgi:hypothetical protein
MAFTDFTSINKVKEFYPTLILNTEKFLRKNITQIEIEPYLEKQIDFGLLSYKPNETFADKFLIAPILNNVWLKHQKLNIWTEKYIKADEMLQGRPDYIVSPLDRKQYKVLSLPIIILVEAKQENFTLGWGQCLAEMLACQKLNKSEDITIYGIVSTGQFWEFGKLEKNVFTNDSNSYSISNLAQTLNIVNYIFSEAENEIPMIDLSIILPDNDQVNNEKTSA